MKDEIKIIQDIFHQKNLKSYWINIQSYENAAKTRDCEREYERELVKMLKTKPFIIGDETNNMFWYISDDIISKNELVTQKVEEYFQKKFNISYPNNLTNESEKIKYDNFLKQLSRQEKLNELGI